MNPNQTTTGGVNASGFQDLFTNLANLSAPTNWVGGTSGQRTLQNESKAGTPISEVKATSNPSQSNIGKALSFAGNVGKEAGGVVGDVIKFGTHAATDAVVAPYRLEQGVQHMYQANSELDAISKSTTALSSRTSSLANDYKTGRISKSEYVTGLKDIAADQSDLVKTQSENQARLNQAGKDLSKGGTDTASDVVAVLTAGISVPLEAAVQDSGVSAAVNFLNKGIVGDALEKAAPTIDKVVQGFGGATAKFTGTQNTFSEQAIAKIASDTSSQVAAETGSTQLAKNIAANVLIKKPLIYQSTFDSAHDAFQELQQGKYGSGIGNMALLASMALAGGPIGYATKLLGKSATAIKDSIFGQSSFIDEISKGIGSGEASQLYNFLSQRGNEDIANSFKVMESTNVKATGGNVVAAANRILDYLDSVGWDRGTMTAEQVAQDMHTLAVNREAIVQAGKNGLIQGLKPGDAERITVGRWSQKDVTKVQGLLADADANLAPGEDAVAARRAVIQQLQDKNGQTAAWLNNDNLQKQIDTIISTKESTQDMVAAIGAIDAQTELAGVPSSIREQLAKDGHIVIMPKSIDAPYVSPQEVANNKLRSEFYSKSPMSDTYMHLPSQGVHARLTQAQADYYRNEVANVKSDANDIVHLSAKTPQLAKQSHEVSLSELSDMSANAKASLGGDGNMFVKSVQPLPVLSSVGSFLTSVGLSPEGSTGATQAIFRQNLAGMLPASLQHLGADASESVDQVVQKLSDFTKNQTGKYRNLPITDFRQFTRQEIMKALNVTEDDATQVMKGLSSAMLQVPLQIRGLGDHIMDLNYFANPLASKYARVQGAARFTWNPFFRWQQSTQTEFLSQLESKTATGSYKEFSYPLFNKVNEMLGFQSKDVNNAIDVLEQKGIFGSGFSGEMADNAAEGAGLIGTKLIPSEKRSLAGLASAMASKANMPIDQFVDQHHQEVLDALRTIVQYPTKGGFLNSPLARTINFAFFPFRYNMKVAGLMAEQLSKFSAPTQVAILKNAFNMGSFLNSSEGQAWYSKHADAIKLFQYLSPLYPLSYVQKITQDVSDPKDARVGDFGLLGGLPFGFISQMLDSNQVIDLSLPYVDPESGKVFPKYVPNSAKGEINLAIQDLLGQTFSYPGSTVGLPSKGSFLRYAANAVLPGSGKDFKQVDESGNLSSQQKQEQQVYQNTAAQTGGTTTGANGQAVKFWSGPIIPTRIDYSVGLPKQAAPIRGDTPLELNQARQAKSSSKKKKSDLIPVPISQQ